jgi:hypothetical protein
LLNDPTTAIAPKHADHGTRACAAFAGMPRVQAYLLTEQASAYTRLAQMMTEKVLIAHRKSNYPHHSSDND